jgi:uncharacterized membrane protein (UPF0127 family)
MMVQNQNQIRIADRAMEASSMLSRMKGLMFSKEMIGFDGLFIKPCNSIHTFFMNYPIDVLFLNKEMKVVKIKRNLRPWRMTRMYLSAHQVLELKGGSLDSRILEGDKLEVICTN